MGRIVCFREKFEDIIEEVLAGDLSSIDTHELGECVDMLKDCAEAEYYEAIVDAMEEDKDYAAEMMPQSVRERMYFSSSDEMTFDEVVEKLNEIVSNADKNEVLTMKQKLAVMVNNM